MKYLFAILLLVSINVFATHKEIKTLSDNEIFELKDNEAFYESAKVKVNAFTFTDINEQCEVHGFYITSKENYDLSRQKKMCISIAIDSDYKRLHNLAEDLGEFNGFIPPKKGGKWDYGFTDPVLAAIFMNIIVHLSEVSVDLEKSEKRYLDANTGVISSEMSTIEKNKKHAEEVKKIFMEFKFFSEKGICANVAMEIKECIQAAVNNDYMRLEELINKKLGGVLKSLHDGMKRKLQYQVPVECHCDFEIEGVVHEYMVRMKDNGEFYR